MFDARPPWIKPLLVSNRVSDSVADLREQSSPTHCSSLTEIHIAKWLNQFAPLASIRSSRSAQRKLKFLIRPLKAQILTPWLAPRINYTDSWNQSWHLQLQRSRFNAEGDGFETSRGCYWNPHELTIIRTTGTGSRLSATPCDTPVTCIKTSIRREITDLRQNDPPAQLPFHPSLQLPKPAPNTHAIFNDFTDCTTPNELTCAFHPSSFLAHLSPAYWPRNSAFFCCSSLMRFCCFSRSAATFCSCSA